MDSIPTDAPIDLEALLHAHEREGLTKLLLAGQEEERRQIAADLHDEIGQCLSAVQFGIGGLKKSLGDRLTDAEDKIFECLSRRLAHAMDEVRRICMRLRPSMLDDLGVLSTIEWFCAELRRVSTRMELVQQVRASEDDIPVPVKVAIFRILQEACSNVCKHAAAHRLSVRLDTDAEGIRLEILDDGAGFDPTSVQRSARGFGLASMRERAAMTNGRLTIWSKRGQGSRVTAEWTACEERSDEVSERLSEA
jgi:signal transduction histidine kinase